MSTAIAPLPDGSHHRDLSRLAFLGAALVPALVSAWVLWLAPITDLAADRTAMSARDFTALWGAGRLAIEGATAALADPTLFTLRLQGWFGPGMPNQIWPYPPPALLLAVPLAHVPLAWSFLLYTSATLLLLWITLRWCGLRRGLCLAVLVSPAVADNALIGQNGAITAAFLVGGLLLIDARPLLAGALFGGLILKPQMGLLLPICLIAGGRWRTGMAALATAACLAGLSWLCFGTAAWVDYLITARPAITAYLEAPWHPDGAHRIFASAFMAARSLGSDLTTAYAVQSVVTLSCAALAFRAWRRPDVDAPQRMALTVALACVASPWVHSYDMPALAVVVVIFAQASRPEHRPWLAVAWWWPGTLTLLAIPNSLLVLSTASIAWLAWRVDRQNADGRSWKTLSCASSVSSS